MKKITYMLLAAAALTFAACNDKEEPVGANDSISVSVDTLQFGPEGGTLDVKIESSGEWRISGLSDWVEPSSVKGQNGATVTFTALESDSKSVKTSSFKVFTGSAVKEIVAVISPSYVIDLLSDAEVAFTSDGGSATVSVDSNVSDLEFEYTGDGADWISFSKRSDAFGKVLLQFEVSRSSAFTDRESTVSIKGQEKSASVKFTQAQRDTVLVEDTRVVYDLSERDIELKVRTNVELNYTYSATWMTLTEQVDGTKASDGLTDYTLKFHLDEATGSRITSLKFTSGSTTLQKMSVKQQNPNPVLCTINDPVLRTTLNDLGWIIGDETSTECEVLETGLTGTSLSLTASSSYYGLKIGELSGLGAFPALESLTLKNVNCTLIDLSDCAKLTSFTISRGIPYVQEIRLGSCPVTTLKLDTYRYEYFESESLTISGDNLESISANSSSYYIYYGYELLTTLDVTGCPALKTLKAKREYSSSWYGNTCILTTIYVTSTQKSAIDAGTLTVEKADSTEITVK